jgi:hypothetical protein
MKFFIILFFFSLQALALEGRVLSVKGDVKMLGSAVSTKVLVPENVEVFVGEKSYIQIELIPSGTKVMVGGNSTFIISTFNKDIEQVSLSKGLARWISGKNSKKGSGINTPQVSMGVRGTDFFASVNPLLGESEIICFEGEVDFANLAKRSDSKIIKKNQWGGLGGRFGAQIGPVLDLPANVIKHFKMLIE